MIQSRTIVLRPRGTSISVEVVANDAATMAQLQSLYKDVYEAFSQAQQEGFLQQQLQRTAANSSSDGSFYSLLTALSRNTPTNTTSHTTTSHATGNGDGDGSGASSGPSGGSGGGGPAIAGTIATLPVSNDQHVSGLGLFLAPYFSITVPPQEFVKSIKITGLPAGEKLFNAAGVEIDPTNIKPSDFNSAFAPGSFSTGQFSAQLYLSADSGSATLTITVEFENGHSGVATASGTLELTSDLNGAPVSWTGGGGDGNWFNSANWSSDHIPLPFEDVLINAPGQTITCAGGVSIDSLFLAAGTLNITSPLFAMTTAAAKPLENHGTISIGSGADMVIGNASFAGDAINSGTLEVVNGGTSESCQSLVSITPAARSRLTELNC